MDDRRFHAETMACHDCGPHVVLWDSQGIAIAEKEEVFKSACNIVRHGGILAVKGLGGFQLWVDASSDQAIERLRLRKHRPKKAFAVLFPSLETIRAHCGLALEEEILLTSPESPIVLLRKKGVTTCGARPSGHKFARTSLEELRNWCCVGLGCVDSARAFFVSRLASCLPVNGRREREWIGLRVRDERFRLKPGQHRM